MDEYKFVRIDKDGSSELIKCNFIDLQKMIHVLEQRDLFIIDKNFDYKISSISTKEKTILVKIDFLKCIIHNRSVYVLLSNNKTNDNTENLIKEFCDVLGKNITKQEPGYKFKLKVLEEIFIYVSDYFEKQILTIAPKVTEAKENLLDKSLHFSLNKIFFDLYNNLINIQIRIKDIYDLFDEMVPDSSNIKNQIEDENIENISKIPKINITLNYIVENYKIRFEGNYRNIKYMKNILDTLIELNQTNLMLQRNTIAKLTLYLTILTISITFSSLITGLFGMNLINKIEEKSIAFPLVSIFIILILFLSFPIIFLIRNKI